MYPITNDQKYDVAVRGALRDLARHDHIVCSQQAEGDKYTTLVECARCGRSGSTGIDLTMSGLGSVRGEIFAVDCTAP